MTLARGCSILGGAGEETADEEASAGGVRITIIIMGMARTGKRGHSRGGRC